MLPEPLPIRPTVALQCIHRVQTPFQVRDTFSNLTQCPGDTTHCYPSSALAPSSLWTSSCTMRSPASPLPYSSGTCDNGCSAQGNAAQIAASSVPTTLFAPHATSSVHSVSSRTVIHFLPK